MEWNKIYKGDNVGLLKQMKEQNLSFNLILTDPPYNVGKDFGNDSDKQSPSDFLNSIEEQISLMAQLSTPACNTVLFCSKIYVCDIEQIMRKYWHQRGMQIWHYENGLSRQTKTPVAEFEPFLWFSGRDDYWIYNGELVRIPYKSDRVKNPVYKKNSKGDKVAWLPNPNGRKRGDIWNFPTLSGKNFEAERTEHPAQKPEALMIELLKAFSPVDSSGKLNARVLDPFGGSGTTFVACEKLNKDGGHKLTWIGIEKEKKWLDIANDRLKKEEQRIQPPDIFR